MVAGTHLRTDPRSRTAGHGFWLAGGFKNLSFDFVLVSEVANLACVKRNYLIDFIIQIK